MALFLAVSPEENEALTAAVEQVYPTSNFKVGPGQYFISAVRTTTTQVSERLGLPGGGRGRVLVVHVLNYTGWHSKNLWEWLAVQSAVPEPPPAPDAPT